MTFDEKVKLLRTLPQFKVIPISEVRAIAFAAQEKSEPAENDFVLAQTAQTTLITLTPKDIQKLLREYPDLQHKF